MKKTIFLFCFFIWSCASLDIPPQFEYKEIQTSYFKLASWQKVTNPAAPYKIYIEGDGSAFRASGSISSDPTPKSKLLREIAFGDEHENVIYLARPCQYIKNDYCQPQYWSTARFSKQVIKSEYEAIKQIAKKNPVTLVGFSGGAQISGLIAVKYPDLQIQKLVTIAGNLDVQSWITYHKLPPLSLSDDLRAYKEEYSLLKQVHYIGGKDWNIPLSVNADFIKNPSSIRLIKDASHNQGWDEVYEQIRQE